MKHNIPRWTILVLALSLVLITFIRTKFPELIGNRNSTDASQFTQANLSSVQDQKRSSNSPLRVLADKRGIHLGAAVLIEPFNQDSTYRAVLAREFNSLSPENAMKFGQLQSQRGRYDFTDADAMVAFARQHHMQIHAHVLVWYRNLPDWLTERQWSRAELMDILREYIYTVVGHFRRRVTSWDVVNEAVNPDGKSLRDSIWLKAIGPDYIELAFRWAHEADPSAHLFYNDYKGEGLGKKSDRIYALLQDLKQRNVPVHGVGLQMHVGIDDPPNPSEIITNMQRLRALGLEVEITEMDVQTLDGIGSNTDKLATQAKVYRDILQTCLQSPNCRGLSTWGIADQFSWIRLVENRPDTPLLFNESYHQKPAYTALQEVLQAEVELGTSKK